MHDPRCAEGTPSPTLEERVEEAMHLVISRLNGTSGPSDTLTFASALRTLADVLVGVRGL